MTIFELKEIKEDINNDISLTDIAMNRAYNKASMVAILNFESVLYAYIENSISKDYENIVKNLKDEIENLKVSNQDDQINSLKNNLNYFEKENNDLKDELIFLKRKISKYENSFFSFLIK